ncbi:MAG: Rpn family recombination-promoting nuclease/putative transposase, partial [Planctomycetaceae bacterium]|nr:Rpn family recombination-promoting nuclease/putative transposase [Planctomycetaceae bacterium]
MTLSAIGGVLSMPGVFGAKTPVYNTFMKPGIIKPTNDLFIAALWSPAENEPILRSLLNAVMTDIGQPAIVHAAVLNPVNIQTFPVDKQIRLDIRVQDETGAM